MSTIVKTINPLTISTFNEFAPADASSKLDPQALEYILRVLQDQYIKDIDELTEIVAPHFVDVAIYADEPQTRALVTQVRDALSAAGVIKAEEADELLNPIQLSELLPEEQTTQLSEASAINTDKLNQQTARYNERKAARLQRKERIANQKKAKTLEIFHSLQAAQAQTSMVRADKHGGSTDVHLENFTLKAGTSTLIRNGNVVLAYGRRYGLIGCNGVGKTTLLKAISGRELDVQRNLSILHVYQEATGRHDQSALECVLECDSERLELLAELDALQADETSDENMIAANARRMTRVYERLDEIDAHTAEDRASEILDGLGFSDAMQAQSTASFSGGWRMRIALARALFAAPDLLLLDEPTNHLDFHAVLWLERYLLEWPSTLVIVSHSRDFLNTVVTDVLHIHHQDVQHYSGSYDDFERARAQRLKQAERSTAAAARQRKHVQRFIDRFRFNAKRASMVQSRIKMLNKMTVVPAIHDDPAIQFGFAEPVHLPPPLLQFQDVTFAYDGAAEPLFENVNLNIDMDSRIALVGANGAGKTTLLKLLNGTLQPSKGHVHRNAKLRFAVFQQHFVDQLDLSLSAVEHLIKLYKTKQLKPQAARAHLGKFGVIGDLAIRSMATLSGGQKSRVVLASIAYGAPSMLLLDEPSNHLDLDSCEALSLALTEYQGGVLLISHDQHLISLVCDEIWVVQDKSVTRFEGTIQKYKKKIGATHH